MSNLNSKVLNKDIYLRLKKSSWDNFFAVMNDRTVSMRRINRNAVMKLQQSLQFLENQYRGISEQDQLIFKIVKFLKESDIVAVSILHDTLEEVSKEKLKEVSNNGKDTG